MISKTSTNMNRSAAFVATHSPVRMVTVLSILACATTLAGCASTPSNNDLDYDGVSNASDDCPLSMPGAAVNAAGCAPDADNDGVANLLDRCPGSPEGSRVDRVGCEVDSDCDGVADALDQCPRTLIGVRVDNVGCENRVVADADRDGVADAGDICPGTPLGEKVDKDGCGSHELIVIAGVNFANDSSELRPVAVDQLRKVVASLQKRPHARISIAGHTDSRNTDAYNMQLSQRRAQAVFDFLANQGIRAQRLAMNWFGESRPVAENNSEEGRARNRRAELRLYEGSPANAAISHQSAPTTLASQCRNQDIAGLNAANCH